MRGREGRGTHYKNMPPAPVERGGDTQYKNMPPAPGERGGEGILLMEAANQVAAYINKLDQQPIRDHNLFWEIPIYIRCKHKIYFDPEGLTRLSLKQILPLCRCLEVRQSCCVSGYPADTDLSTVAMPGFLCGQKMALKLPELGDLPPSLALGTIGMPG